MGTLKRNSRFSFTDMRITYFHKKQQANTSPGILSCFLNHYLTIYGVLLKSAIQNFYTLYLKKVPTLKLCNFDFKNVCTAGKRTKCAIKAIRHYPFHFRHVATLHWKIKKSFLCRYSADMEENGNIF